jgi:pimeloyl-ACP methyl ester carboxylesterase
MIMPLISVVRFITTLLSLIILAAVVYLLWSWNEGDLIRQADGGLVRVREDWRLWTALALGAFSLIGRFVVLPLLAAPDRGERSYQDSGPGKMINGANGAQLYVEELGSQHKDTIIFTHGWAMDNTIWHYAKRDFAEQFRVIVWDLPGLGKSKGEISLENFASNLAAVIDHSGASRVGLVGHSIGGMTIQTLARDNAAFFNTRVSAAVLVNTTYTNPLKTMILPRFMQAIRFPLLEPIMRLTILLQPLAWVSTWQSYLSGMSHVANRLGFGKHVTRSQLEHVTLLSTKNPPGNIQKGNLAMFRWDATGALGSVTVPVLLLAGDLDIVTKPSASATLSQQGRTTSLQTIEGVNHMGLMERADVYNAAMIRFFQSAQTT